MNFILAACVDTNVCVFFPLSDVVVMLSLILCFVDLASCRVGASHMPLYNMTIHCYMGIPSLGVLR